MNVSSSEAAATEIAYWRGVEGDLLRRLAADRVGDDARADQAGHARRRGRRPASAASAKRGRGGDLALGPAREDLQRDELAHEGEEGEEGQLRIEEPVEGVEPVPSTSTAHAAPVATTSVT